MDLPSPPSPDSERVPMAIPGGPLPGVPGTATIDGQAALREESPNQHSQEPLVNA
jgi:hypothetical protein